jgi:hypothetical protein
MTNNFTLVKRLWFLVPALAVAGCNEVKLEVQRYPVFYDPAIRTVAVLPFDNQTLHPMAGAFLADRLAEQLKANGTYIVISPKELASRMSAGPTTMPAKPTVEQAAEAMRKLGGVDAFITGTVRQFGADRGTYTEVYDDPWYHGGYYGGYYGGSRRHWGRGGHGYYGDYYGGYYPVYRQYSYSQAYVSALATMCRVSDAGVIYSTPSPAAARLTSGGGITLPVDEVLSDAAETVSHDIVATFAIVPRQVKVKKDHVLRPAIRIDGRVKYTTDFKPGDDGLYVEVSLPPEADRNEFRLAVARKNQPPIAEQKFTWNRADSTREFFFALPQIAEAGGGKGDYELRLYGGDKAEIERGIKIKQ